MDRYRDRFRLKTTRLPHWDYASPGLYFVTICPKNLFPFFGKIETEQMILSPIGEIVSFEWLKTEAIRSHVKLDEWILMPNHLHGIITLQNEVETPRRGVSTAAAWKSNSLGAIINQFKSTCTKRIRSEGFADFAWQSRYYDHIIRND